MGLLTGSELVAEVIDFLAGRDDVDTARILRSLNLVQEYVEQLFEPDELEVVLTGSLVVNSPMLAFTSLTAIPRRIYSFTLRTSDGRSQKLTGYSPKQFDAAFPDPEFYSTDIPLVYTKFANGLELFPYPDETYPYRIRAQKKATAWTEENMATQKSDLEGKDLALVNYALSHLYDSLGEPTKSARFFSVAEDKIAKLAQFEDLREPDRLISSETAAYGHRLGTGRPWADPFVLGDR